MFKRNFSGWALSRDLVSAIVTSDILTHSYILKLRVNPIHKRKRKSVHSNNIEYNCICLQVKLTCKIICFNWLGLERRRVPRLFSSLLSLSGGSIFNAGACWALFSLLKQSGHAISLKYKAFHNVVRSGQCCCCEWHELCASQIVVFIVLLCRCGNCIVSYYVFYLFIKVLSPMGPRARLELGFCLETENIGKKSRHNLHNTIQLKETFFTLIKNKMTHFRDRDL